MYTCGRQMSCYLRTMERTFVRSTRNSNKEDLAFSQRVTGRSRAVEIFWKYANYQLASFLRHCAGFYDRYHRLPSLAVHLVSSFCPVLLLSCLFLSRFSGLSPLAFSCFCTKRDATPFTFFSFLFFFQSSYVSIEETAYPVLDKGNN